MVYPKMNRGIVYLNKGDSCTFRLMTSIHSVRQHHTEAAIALLQVGEPTEWITHTCAHYSVEIMRIDRFKDTHPFVIKSMMPQLSPFHCSIFLDSDTLILQPLEELWDAARDHGLAFTAFSDWKLQSGVVKKRAKCFKKEFPKLWETFDKAKGPAINVGVFAFMQDHEITDTWIKMSKFAFKKTLTPEESAATVLSANIECKVLPPTWNVSGKYEMRKIPEGKPKIYHYHGKKHCIKTDAAKLWVKTFTELKEKFNIPLEDLKVDNRLYFKFSNNVPFDLWKDVVTKSEKCFETIIEQLCRRCAVIDNEYFPYNKQPHHQGKIQNHLIGKGVTHEDVDKYFNDIEHGFIHGLCACVSAWLYRNTLSEKEIASILMHDFYRACDKGSHNHDKRLKELYPNLEEYTYSHSKPPEQYQLSPLVVADREELHRYDDAEEWVDAAGWVHRDDTFDIDLYNAFYNKVRPAIERLYEGRNTVWLRHGYEKSSIRDPKLRNSNPTLWPIQSPKYDGHHAIEIDKPPLKNCGQHGGGNPKHGDTTWYRVQAHRPLTPDVEVVDKDIRDHLWMKNKFPIEEWTFLLPHKDAYRHHEYLKGKHTVVFTPSGIEKVFEIARLLECKLKVLTQV